MSTESECGPTLNDKKEEKTKNRKKTETRKTASANLLFCCLFSFFFLLNLLIVAIHKINCKHISKYGRRLCIILQCCYVIFIYDLNMILCITSQCGFYSFSLCEYSLASFRSHFTSKFFNLLHIIIP